MMPAPDYQPSRSLPARIWRKLTQYHCTDPVTIAPERPILSIGFDDFPLSAARNGAKTCEDQDMPATFYVASTFLDTQHPIMGPMMNDATIIDLARRGHEIGAHTKSHFDCARQSRAHVKADLDDNLAHLNGLPLDQTIDSFAYPYGETTIGLKADIVSRFSNGRGVNSGLNRGKTDAAQLRANLITDEPWRIKAIEDLIEAAVQKPGWLILFTHDVQREPGPWGCQPETLAGLLSAAKQKGFVFATTGQTMRQIKGIC
jgi:peptidoglycan/xylan/chitin deacetylase (PgdA/CDA1 family)